MGVNGIYGLSGSGLDIESMVKVGMMGKQNEYDRMYKKQTQAEWQKEAYADVYKSINDFNTTKLTDYKLQSKMSAMTATTNNTSAFSVTANGAAAAMSHKVEVKSLSSNAYLMSTKAIERATSADSDSINLKDSMFQKITANGDDTYTIKDWDGNTKTVNADDVALSVTLNDGQSQSEKDARTVTVTYADLAGNKSFNDLASEINKLGLNITASYDSVNDTFSLYNKNGGADNTISITANNDATAQLFNNLNLGESRNGELTEFSATAPEAITGTNTGHFGTDKVTDILGITVSDLQNGLKLNGDFVTEVEDDTLDSGVKKYQKDDGSEFLVQTYTEDQVDEEGNVVTDENGDAVTVTKYKTAEVPTDGSAVDWSSIEGSETNPITSFNYYNVTDSEGNTTRHEDTEQVFSFSFNDGHGGRGVGMSYGALKDMTIDDVVNEINGANRNVKASFNYGVFNISNELAGSDQKLTFQISDSLAGKFFNALGIGDGSARQTWNNSGTGTQFNAGYETEIAGSNGEIVVDGRSYTNITDNRATIGGVTYTLFDTTTSAATVTVTQDTDAIIDRVKQFVEDYNTMLQSLQDKYNETKYSDYGVLTKAQEDAMTKEQVEKWNEKAKSGLLTRDKYVGDIISKMREALATPVEGVSGKYNSAFNIGITTITDQGKIELDEDKLKKALAAEPNSVYEIFGKMGDYNSSTKTSDFSTSGVAQRLSDVFNNGLKNIKSHAGTSTEVDDNSELGNRIKEWQNKMSDFKTKMKAFEDLLYKKYDAMEMALQKLAMTMNYVSFNQQ
jgi:flagellar hook-associated protein 2